MDNRAEEQYRAGKEMSDLDATAATGRILVDGQQHGCDDEHADTVGERPGSQRDEDVDVECDADRERAERRSGPRSDRPTHEQCAPAHEPPTLRTQRHEHAQKHQRLGHVGRTECDAERRRLTLRQTGHDVRQCHCGENRPAVTPGHGGDRRDRQPRSGPHHGQAGLAKFEEEREPDARADVIERSQIDAPYG